eukprot:TRINITY_DN2890_c0_g2_i1.p1 TRINITY_DN2890_c0_g2~~TRINITY_DN2890_c0_g2_i1.p1  ORF type:complete len:179 (+),score=24.25 TRINITY_DN2890_c0_g2_i1:308-844(+)
MLPLFRQHRVGFLSVPQGALAAFNGPNPAAFAPKSVDQIASPLAAPPVGEMPLCVRAFEMRGAYVGSKSDPLPAWFLDLDKRMPSLQLLRMQPYGNKLQTDYFKHQNLTTLILTRHATTRFYFNGASLVRLKKLTLTGSLDCDITVFKFSALLFLCVYHFTGTLSVSECPQLHSLNPP